MSVKMGQPATTRTARPVSAPPTAANAKAAGSSKSAELEPSCSESPPSDSDRMSNRPDKLTRSNLQRSISSPGLCFDSGAFKGLDVPEGLSAEFNTVRLTQSMGPSMNGGVHAGGNRPAYTPDPTQDHVDGVCDPDLSEKPLMKGDKWDSGKILSNLTQTDTMRTNTDRHRCTPSSLVASAVVGGKAATAKLADSVAAKTTDPVYKKQAQAIAARIRDGTANLGDLSKLQNIIYYTYKKDWTSAGFSAKEATNMIKGLATKKTALPGKKDSDGFISETPAKTAQRIDRLQKGQTLIMGIDGRGDGKPDHAVTIGRDKQGRLFVYDPMPKSGQPAIIYKKSQPKAFDRYINGTMGPKTEVGGDRTGTRANHFVAVRFSFD